VTDDDYKRTLAAAQDELSDLLIQRAGIDDRINKLRESVLALSRLVGDDLGGYSLTPTLAAVHLREVGLTEAVRGVLQNAKRAEADAFLSPTNVRDRLKEAGFNLDKYKNEMAAIGTILTRLTDLEEVEPQSFGGKTTYRWKGDVSPVDPKLIQKFFDDRKQRFLKVPEEPKSRVLRRVPEEPKKD